MADGLRLAHRDAKLITRKGNRGASPCCPFHFDVFIISFSIKSDGQIPEDWTEVGYSSPISGRSPHKIVFYCLYVSQGLYVFLGYLGEMMVDERRGRIIRKDTE